MRAQTHCADSPNAYGEVCSDGFTLGGKMSTVDFCDDSNTPSIGAQPCAVWNVDTSVVVDWHTLLMLVQQPAATWSKQMTTHVMTATPSITMAVATHVLLKLGTGAQSWVPAAARHEAKYVATLSVLVVKPFFAFDISCRQPISSC